MALTAKGTHPRCSHGDVVFDPLPHLREVLIFDSRQRCDVICSRVLVRFLLHFFVNLKALAEVDITMYMNTTALFGWLDLHYTHVYSSMQVLRS